MLECQSLTLTVLSLFGDMKNRNISECSGPQVKSLVLLLVSDLKF